MPNNRKSPKKYIAPALFGKAGVSVFALILTLLASSATCVIPGLLLIFPQLQPTLPTTAPTNTLSIFFENQYPTGGIQQSIVIETIKDNMDVLESTFSWAILIAITIGWAGLIKQGDIEIVGIKVKRKYAFYLVAALYLIVNFALIILFVRLGELLLLLDNPNFLDGLSKITVHTWLLNPYSFFGYSLLSRSFSSLGFGLLIFCWWICYTSLYLLRDGKETTTTKTLPILFLLLGLLALIVIERNYSIITFRLTNINAEFFNAMNLTKIERSVVEFVGIGLGVGFFIFAVNMQSKLAKKPVAKENLVYCPECNLPFKSEPELAVHVKNWHFEKAEKIEKQKTG